MKKLNLFFIVSLVITLSISFFFEGCSDDTTSPGSTSAGYKPTIRLKVNSSYQYTNDTLFPSGVSQRTNMITNDTIQTDTNYNGKNAFRIISHTTSRPTVDYYVSYDSTNGFLYQWGITNLFNPSQTPTWDVVANFQAARGATWVIGQINDTLTVPLPPPTGTVNIPVSGPLTGKVVDSTFILTTSTPPDTVHCYHILINANVSGTVVIAAVNITFSTSIDVDYYVGFYSAQFPGNPSGLARLRLNPFIISTSPNIGTFNQGGYDRILQTFNIAP